MENYYFKLTPANRAGKINFKEIEDSFQLFSIAANNCSTGLSFRRDGKKITIIEITDDYLKIILSSSFPLNAPKRTLSAFSRELLRLDQKTHCLSSSIYNHTLFNTEAIEMPASDSMTVDDMSNSQLLKFMVDLLYTPLIESEQVRKQVINSIKEIALPFLSE